MPAFTENDRALIACLHHLVFEDALCRRVIEAGLQQASQRFTDPQYSKSYSSVTLPIELFRDRLPDELRDEVRLVRVFAIKAGQRAPHEEIHRNSVQRLVSFQGAGAVNCAQPGGVDKTYRKFTIDSPDLSPGGGLAGCWDVVPENTWHFPEARGAGQWFGVAFHSAAADRIEDEYISVSD